MSVDRTAVDIRNNRKCHSRVKTTEIIQRDFDQEILVIITNVKQGENHQTISSSGIIAQLPL